MEKEVRDIKRRNYIFFILLLAFGLLTFFYLQRDPMTEVSGRLQDGEKAERLKDDQTEKITDVYLIKREGSPERIVQKISVAGFVKNITILISVDYSSEKIQQVEIVDHSESDDYGGYLTETWFLNRFLGKDVNKPLEVVKMIDKNPTEIVAITGATKTSQAVVTGVNLALENFLKIKEELSNENE